MVEIEALSRAGRTVADQLVSILSDNKTLDILDQVPE